MLETWAGYSAHDKSVAKLGPWRELVAQAYPFESGRSLLSISACHDSTRCFDGTAYAWLEFVRWRRRWS